MTFLEIAAKRRSTRRFKPSEDIPPLTLERLLSATMRTPTSFNLQPYAVVLVRKAEAKEKLSTAMLGGNRFRVRDASVTAVFLSDLEPSKRISSVMSIEKGYRSPEYTVMMPLATSYFSGEGPWIGNVIKNAAAGIVSPVKPMPTVPQVSSSFILPPPCVWDMWCCVPLIRSAGILWRLLETDLPPATSRVSRYLLMPSPLPTPSTAIGTSGGPARGRARQRREFRGPHISFAHVMWCAGPDGLPHISRGNR